MSLRPDPHPPSLHPDLEVHPDLEAGLCTSLGRTMAKYDLSSLPYLVLEKLFKMLPVPDRGHLASCNRRLSLFMGIASMWKDVNLDEFDLYTESIDDAQPWMSEQVKVVGKLRARDFSMIKKYGQHFENVKVVIHSNRIERQSLAMLADLGYRQVIKSVSLRLDLLLSKVMNLKKENPLVERALVSTIFFGNVIGLPLPGSGRMYPPASHIIDNLSLSANFTIALPPQSHNIRDFFEQGFEGHRLRDIHDCTFFFYSFDMSTGCRSRLKKLMLSPLPLTEEVIAIHLSWLRSRSVQLSPPPTAVLMSSFPNLQELHVNIVSLSDQLLQELCGAPGRSRKPLQSLVIRHIVCDCEVEGVPDPYSQQLFCPWYNGTFPQLSSTAWAQLAQSSPSLTVECSVMSDKMPQLLDVIKPQTPLVRLEVLCRTTNNDDQSVPVLQQLSVNHSRLTIVGVRFRACSCTSTDS